jgi:FkbM family methyltransferase
MRTASVTSCPVKVGGRLRGQAAAKHYALHAAIPLLRAAVRYGRGRTWREHLWWRIVAPYVGWHRHSFVARTRFGRRLAGATSEILQQHVYYFGEWESDLTAWITNSLGPGDVMIDVGANVGYFSLLGSRLVGKAGAVVAIEASPRIHDVLRSNLALNRAENVRSVNVAASDSHGTVSLFAGYEAHLGVASVVRDQGAGIEAEVPTVPLADILTPDEIRRTRLIKIDVEGAEWSVLTGARDLWDLARDDLELVVEVHPDHLELDGRTVGEITRFLAERGFHPYRLDVDYSASAYLARTDRRRPLRVRDPVNHQTHLVFSRRDTDHL